MLALVNLQFVVSPSISPSQTDILVHGSDLKVLRRGVFHELKWLFFFNNRVDHFHVRVIDRGEMLRAPSQMGKVIALVIELWRLSNLAMLR